MNATYQLVAKVQSQADGRRFYEIKREKGTRKLSCSCPSWIYGNYHGKTCKHIKELRLQDLGLKVRLANR